jgi:response regulator of citrate/malate metabolism
MIRTLVVDDDVRVADVHCAYVERVPGFVTVGKAHTGASALGEVARLRPDLLLLDFYLPDLSGLEVLRRLRDEDHPPVDVIAITAARDVENLRAAIRSGVVHYLVKPFRFAAFEEKLASYASLVGPRATFVIRPRPPTRTPYSPRNLPCPISARMRAPSSPGSPSTIRISPASTT